jgi:hypothetical protein
MYGEKGIERGNKRGGFERGLDHVVAIWDIGAQGEKRTMAERRGGMTDSRTFRLWGEEGTVVVVMVVLGGHA